MTRRPRSRRPPDCWDSAWNGRSARRYAYRRSHWLQVMSVRNAIERGREAVARRAWARAFRTFELADRARPLGPQDLEHLAVAAYMLGRSDDHLECMKRAH